MKLKQTHELHRDYGDCYVRSTLIDTYRGYGVYYRQQIDIYTDEPFTDGVTAYFAVNVSNPARPLGECIDRNSKSIAGIKAQVDYSVDGYKFDGRRYYTTPLVDLRYFEQSA